MAGKWRKSSRSQGSGGNCVEARIQTWRKSSRSSAQGECVEARTHQDQLQIRDSKLGDTSPILSMNGNDFTALLANLKH